MTWKWWVKPDPLKITALTEAAQYVPPALEAPARPTPDQLMEARFQSEMDETVKRLKMLYPDLSLGQIQAAAREIIPKGRAKLLRLERETKEKSDVA